jgi:hypothetical protein
MAMKWRNPAACGDKNQPMPNPTPPDRAIRKKRTGARLGSVVAAAHRVAPKVAGNLCNGIVIDAKRHKPEGNDG